LAEHGKKMVWGNEERGHHSLNEKSDYISCLILTAQLYLTIPSYPCSGVGTPLSFCKQGLAKLITNIRIA
jgi:hypothetical protein